MNELIKTSNNENGEIIVSGRELHEFLMVSTEYAKWMSRMIEYGFVENVDFIVIVKNDENPLGGRPKQDHHIKLDMAKEIAMIQRTEKGKQARQYFLQVEKAWNSPEMIMKRALIIANKSIEQLTVANEEMEKKIEADKPKVFFANAVEISDSSILVKRLAILLSQKGYKIGQNRLFEWLRENDYLCKNKAFWNNPTQKSMDKGLFEVSTHIHTGSDGIPKTKYTPKVTGKGQIYFINKLLGNKKSLVDTTN